jgi:hypothetical protein
VRERTCGPEHLDTGKSVRLADPSVVPAGRQDLLAELGHLAKRRFWSWATNSCMCGLAEAGKTQCGGWSMPPSFGRGWSRLKARRRRPSGRGGRFGQLAAQLRIREVVDVRDPAASVQGVLAVVPAEGLLVFDNRASDGAAAVAAIPASGGRLPAPMSK